MTLKVVFIQANYFGPNTVTQSAIKEEKQHTHVTLGPNTTLGLRQLHELFSSREWWQ